MNKLQLVSKRSQLAREGFKPGDFVATDQDGVSWSLGNSIRPTIQDVRPMAIRFQENADPKVSYDPRSPWFRETVELSYEKFAFACYGSEVILRIKGRLFVLNLVSRLSRRLAPRLRNAIGHKTILESLKVETHRFSWYQIEAWVPAYLLSHHQECEPEPEPVVNPHIETCCKLYDVCLEVAEQWREDGDRRYKHAKAANYSILYGEER